MRRRGHEDVASKDVYLNGFALVAVVAYLLLMLINPPTKKETTKPPGNIMVLIVWPDGGEQDVDLWTWSEGEERPVGFSNRSGTYWSLLRDDLGKRNDTTPINSESSFSREIPKGRTTINLHCFTCNDVPVQVAIEVRVVIDGWARPLFETKVTLHHNGQEVTVASFELTDKGALVPGSMNSAFRPLYKDWGR